MNLIVIKIKVFTYKMTNSNDIIEQEEGIQESEESKINRVDCEK